MAQITVLLERINDGDAGAFDELVPLVYQELRQQAQRYLSGRNGDHTLQPTALVHEAFIKLVGGREDWRGSRHFYHAAAQVMRQILVGHARARRAQKRVSPGRRIDLDELPATVRADETDWEALDAALGELANRDPRRYQVVMLRFFSGLTDAQTASALDISEKTVERDWATARAFLKAWMEKRDR